MSTIPQAAPNAAVLTAEQQRCFDLRLEGKSLRAIASETGLSKDTVQRRINSAAEAYISPRVEALRAQHDAQFDLVYEETLATIRDTDDAELKLKAIATLLRIQDRQAKLHGMDAPTRVEANVVHETQQDVELREMLQHFEAANQAEQAALDASA